MKDESTRKPIDEPAADALKMVSGVAMPARRRLLRGGAAATPVILTFTSRPVFGFENACVAPSRMISGNFSGFQGPPSCGGTSLADLKAQAVSSTESYWDSKFSDIFNPGYTNTDPNKLVPDTFRGVFLDSYAGGDGLGTSQFAAYIIAAYLNSGDAAQAVNDVLGQAQIQHMWHDVATTGSYEPQLGMPWDATEVIGYLRNSGIVPLA